MARSADILSALDRAGADVLEVGIPFQRPSPTVGPQARTARPSRGRERIGCARFCEKGAPTGGPIVLLTTPPVMRMGGDVVGIRARARVRGVLVLDLPSRGGGFRARCGRESTCLSASPTTTDARVTDAAKLGGVLIRNSRLASPARANALRMRAGVAMRIARQPRSRSRWASGFRRRYTYERVAHSPMPKYSEAVCGASSGWKKPELIERVEAYVRWLRATPHMTSRAQTADRSS